MMLFCRLAFVSISLMGLGIALAQHDTPKTGRNNFWVSLIATAIQLLLLWGGGFFK